MENSLEIDSRIVKFIKQHHVMTLSTGSEKGVWCCNLFYTYSEGCLIFTSKSETRHIKEGLNKDVGVSVVLESRVIGNLQGVQIVGRLVCGNEQHKSLYLKRFPYAALALEEIWVVQIGGIKFTDNKLGFGKKLYWGSIANQ